MSMPTGNCPDTQSMLFHALETMQAIRVRQDCTLELDRLNSEEKHAFLDELATAIACTAMAYEKLKGGKIGYSQGLHPDLG